ncbi:hypothetical protein NDU88_000626 [Pleurodeles waltl]|uniref:Uncharacterized protein n=1 Tax=Pleurodeles waltl TaxID=8319 RepID=A0AAV7S565_PLEWA|nr:hypothetical protein NDU88_000626 [Pleurodeles waltl]
MHRPDSGVEHACNTLIWLVASGDTESASVRARDFHGAVLNGDWLPVKGLHSGPPFVSAGSARTDEQ